MEAGNPSAAVRVGGERWARGTCKTLPLVVRRSFPSGKDAMRAGTSFPIENVATVDFGCKAVAYRRVYVRQSRLVNVICASADARLTGMGYHSTKRIGFRLDTVGKNIAATRVKLVIELRIRKMKPRSASAVLIDTSSYHLSKYTGASVASAAPICAARICSAVFGARRSHLTA
jgi:hypothetical protein